MFGCFGKLIKGSTLFQLLPMCARMNEVEQAVLVPVMVGGYETAISCLL